MNVSRPLDLLGTLAAKLQDAVGSRTGDVASEARDRAEQAASQAQDAYGELLDVVERVASSRPLVIVAAAASVGFVLGLLVARR